MNANEMIVNNMFNFMVQTDTSENVRALLVERYPDHVDFIATLKREDEGLFSKTSTTVNTMSENTTPVTSTLPTVTSENTNPAPAAAPAPAKKVTKRDRARALYAAAVESATKTGTTVERKDIIALFVKELEITKGNASIYYSIVTSK